jgi:hypothetical protein
MMENLSSQFNMEQLEAALRNFAPCIGTYYLALIAAGTPEDMAGDLVAQWHAMYWAKAIGVALESQ